MSTVAIMPPTMRQMRAMMKEQRTNGVATNGFLHLTTRHPLMASKSAKRPPMRDMTKAT